MSASFILSLWIFSVSLSPLVRGQTRVVGPPQPVQASVGEAVVLPCRCGPRCDLGPMTVEWSRTELKPHPSDRLKRVPFVHVYTARHEDMDMKIPEFVNRTQLFPEQFADGIASLRIQRVALTDNGTYKCFIPDLGEEAFVTLIVHPAEQVTPNKTEDAEPKENDISPDPPSTRLRVGLAFTVVVVFIIGIAVFVIVKKSICKLHKPDVEKQSVNTDQSEVSAEEGKKLITKCPTDDTGPNTRQVG